MPFAGTAGLVYEIQVSGKVKTLYTFDAAAGGTGPSSFVTLDARGLYGTTALHGDSAELLLQN